MFATVGGLVGSIILKFLPQMMDLSFLAAIGFSKANAAGVYEIPFLDRMFIVFWVVIAGMVAISKLAESQRDPAHKPLHVDTSLFRVDGAFAAGSAIICVMLASIYTAWW
jgi:SSS family solute:Na+ symporter